jgi:hypothetical protein
VQIAQARALAADWLRGHDFGGLPVVGAFLAGSTVDADPADELAADSDVDLSVVVAGPAPTKLGLLDHRGLRLEVTFLSWADLADPAVVARTYYLAPSFARDTVLADPDGRLRRLHHQVAPQFARPDVVRARWAGLLQRMDAAPRADGPWPEVVTGWLFSTSLSTLVVLVAARRNPTVRLRYLRAREALAAYGLAPAYPVLLQQLGCVDTEPGQVAARLPALAAAFDAAADCGPTGLFFASALTAAARPVAVAGAAALVERGDHREAVFWLVATFSRCLQVLAAAGAPTAPHLEAFRATVADLLGLRSPADLLERHADVRATLPWLDRLAEEILDHGR